MVCMRLRVKDLDLSHRAIYVRDGKGGKDRVVTLPEDLLLPLRRQLVKVRGVHEKDLAVCLSRLETIDGPPLR
jgi:integrase